MYKKTKELGYKKPQDQNIGTEGFKGNIVIDETQ
jgi:hypothetical protein